MNRTAFTGFMLMLLIATFGMAVHQINANPIVVPIINVMSPKDCIYDTNQIDLIFEAPSPRDLNVTFISFSYSLDGKPKIPIAGNITLEGLSMGTHSVVVYGLDTDGWTQSSQSVHFNVYVPSTWIVVVIAFLAVALTATVYLVYFKKRRNKQKPINP